MGVGVGVGVWVLVRAWVRVSCVWMSVRGEASTADRKMVGTGETSWDWMC